MKKFYLIVCIVLVFGFGYALGTSQTSVVQPALAADDILEDPGDEVETPAMGARYIQRRFRAIKFGVARELRQIHEKVHEHSPAAINTALGGKAASLAAEYNTMRTWVNNHTPEDSEKIPALLTPPAEPDVPEDPPVTP